MRYGFSAFTILFVVLSLITPLSTVAPTGAQGGGGGYSLIHMEKYGVDPKVVFGRFIVGTIRDSVGTAYVAVDLYTGREKILAYAEAIGVDPQTARFAKSGGYLLLIGRNAVFVWDANMSMVGRFAMEDLAGAVVSEDTLVAWGGSTVATAPSPGFANYTVYDIWSMLYSFFEEGSVTPEELLDMTGENSTEIKQELVQQALEYISEQGGVPITVSVNFRYDIGGGSSEEARASMHVEVYAADIVGGVLYAVAGIGVGVAAEVEATYVVTEENHTSVERYEYQTGFYQQFGALLRVDGENVQVEEIYYSVDSAASYQDALAYVYVPSINESAAPKMLRLLAVSSSWKAELYTTSGIDSIIVRGGTVFVSYSGILQMIYMGKLIASIPARVVDVGEAYGKLYVLYVNSMGVAEVGRLDKYTGWFGKLVVETKGIPIGVNATSDTIFLIINDGGKALTEVYAEEPLAILRIELYDLYGNKVSVINATAAVRHGPYEYTEVFLANPIVVYAPLGSDVYVAAYGPYWKFRKHYTLDTPGVHEYAEVVESPFVPGSAASSAVFYNVFYGGYVILSDEKIPKHTLPGAASIDAYGDMLAIIESNATDLVPYTSTVSVYRVNGMVLYRLVIPGDLDKVKFFYPYLVASSDTKIVVVDAATGFPRYEADIRHSGYDVDVVGDYVSLWDSGRVVVADLRRHTSYELDLSEYGSVAAAPAVGGVVYAYVVGGHPKIVMIDASSASIIGVLPWDGSPPVQVVSDGAFHAVSYATERGYRTDVISVYNGLVSIEGKAVWVRTLGKVVNLPGSPTIYGNMFAAVVAEDNSTIVGYVVGTTTYKAVELSCRHEGVTVAPTMHFIAVFESYGGRGFVELKDYSGTTRVTISTSVAPLYAAATDSLIAYGDSEKVYMVPRPTAIGRYKITVEVVDEEGRPLDASIYIEEYGVWEQAVGGLYDVYLSSPGIYHIVVSAPDYVDKEVSVGVSESSPATVVKVEMQPRRYRVEFGVYTVDGEKVENGTLTVEGVSAAYYRQIDLSEEQPILYLRKGTYKASFSSPLYSYAEVVFTVDKDMAVSLVTNRTAVRLRIKVMAEDGKPLQANVKIEGKALPSPMELKTDSATGETEAYLPYGATVSVTVSASGYEPWRRTLNATVELEKKPLEVVLKKPVATIVVTMEDEDGKPVSATVEVRDQLGRIVATAKGSGTAAVTVPPGTYRVVGVSEDGRRAEANVVVPMGQGMVSVKLVFPKKPTPLYIVLYPFILIGLVAATIVVVIYKMTRKIKPRVVR